jgi:hypothetical protein
LRHYVTSCKVAGSRPDEVIDFFFSIYGTFPTALDPGVCSASNRNEHQNQKIIFLGSRERTVLKADKLTAVCDPIV